MFSKSATIFFATVVLAFVVAQTIAISCYKGQSNTNKQKVQCDASTPFCIRFHSKTNSVRWAADCDFAHYCKQNGNTSNPSLGLDRITCCSKNYCNDFPLSQV